MHFLAHHGEDDITSSLYKSRTDLKMKHTCRAKFLFNIFLFTSFDLENYALFPPRSSYRPEGGFPAAESTASRWPSAVSHLRELAKEGC